MDREFIGNKWLTWLKNQKVPFCVRVPKSHKITLPDGEKVHVKDLLKERKRFLMNDVIIDDLLVNVSLFYNDNGELIYLIGTIPKEDLRKCYKRRWGIEVFFPAIKDRGFDLESSRIRTFE